MPRASSRSIRRGLTLVELLLAVAILTMSVVALGMMGQAVRLSTEFNEGYGAANQHARVVLNRIQRTVTEAYGAQDYCGAWLTDTTITSTNRPDTLVLWRPTGTPVNAAGPPLARELVIYCPDSADPNQLLEITAPADSSAMPAPGTSAFQTFIAGIKSASTSQKSVLTDLVQTVAGKGMVRFSVTLNPSAADWSSYQSGTKSWESLPWVQGIVGPNYGLRQVAVRTELQLMPAGQWIATDPAAKEVVPYLGSATYCYGMKP